MREFLYVDDMATAPLFVLQLDREIYMPTPDRCFHTSEDCTAREMAESMKRVVAFEGDLMFDSS